MRRPTRRFSRLRTRAFSHARKMALARRILDALPRLVPAALPTVLPDKRVRWDDVERVELRGPEDLPPVVLIRWRGSSNRLHRAKRIAIGYDKRLELGRLMKTLLMTLNSTGSRPPAHPAMGHDRATPGRGRPKWRSATRRTLSQPWPVPASDARHPRRSRRQSTLGV